jgi:hypothetical protein
MTLPGKHTTSRCAVFDCPSPVWGRHLCQRHYQRWHDGYELPPHRPEAGRGSRDHGYSSARTASICVCADGPEWNPPSHACGWCQRLIDPDYREFLEERSGLRVEP